MAARTSPCSRSNPMALSAKLLPRSSARAPGQTLPGKTSRARTPWSSIRPATSWPSGDLGTDNVATYALNDETGELTLVSEVDSQPGSGPRHLVFNSAGTLHVRHQRARRHHQCLRLRFRDWHDWRDLADRFHGSRPIRGHQEHRRDRHRSVWPVPLQLEPRSARYGHAGRRCHRRLEYRSRPPGS